MQMIIEAMIRVFVIKSRVNCYKRITKLIHLVYFLWRTISTSLFNFIDDSGFFGMLIIIIIYHPCLF